MRDRLLYVVVRKNVDLTFVRATSSIPRGFVNFGTVYCSKSCWLLSINPFPNKPWILRVCSESLLKTPWEKEKWLVTSNFSFSHGVFYLFGEPSAIFIKFEIVVCKLFQFGSIKNVSFGKGVKAELRKISC